MVKSCCITGGAKGIGAGITLSFIKKGWDCMITGRDEAACIECCKNMEDVIAANGTSNRISYFIGDVGIRITCDNMIQSVIDRHDGKLDVLVCNAGIYPEATLEECTEYDMNETMRINYNGTVYSIQSALERLKESSAGRIIIISSITGPITGNLGFAHYGATKAAQLGYMRTCALELAQYNITVNAILPGNILTDGLGQLGDEYVTRMEARIPLKRLGKPEDIGNAAIFLASDESSYITGISLNVDGGQVLPES